MKRKNNNKVKAFLSKYQLGGNFVGREVNPEYIESLKSGSGAYPKFSSDSWKELAKFPTGDTIVRADTDELFLRDNKDGKYYPVEKKDVETFFTKPKPVPVKSKEEKVPENIYRASSGHLPKSTQDYSTKDETKLQKQWLQDYMKSDIYQERLKAEGFKNPKQEAQTRLNNLNTAPISYVKSIGKRPRLISGVYTPEHKIELETEYRPASFNPAPGFETIPLHEMYHASDKGGKRIPKQTIKNIQERTNTPTNKFEEYYTTPTEFIGRIQPTRYLLQREGIYDASKKAFDEKDYENMLKNRGVRENTHFQEFYESVKGKTEKEKKENFIWFMNNIAQAEQESMYYGQLGGDYDMQDPYNYAPDLQTAQQQQIVQFNQPQDQMAYQAPQQNPFSLMGAVPFIGPAINLGIGVKSIIDSFGQRKRQKQYERAYKKDLEQRMEESRVGDYYRTPYSYQLGGTSEQMGVLDPYEYSEMDDFLSYYNQKENQNQIQQQKMEQWYDTNNQKYENQWRTNQSQGISNALSGAIGLASMFQEGGSFKSRPRHKIITVMGSDGKEKQIVVKDTIPDKPLLRDTIPNNPRWGDAMRDTSNKSKSKDRFRAMQDGGEINEYNPKTDLYSPEYDPNEFLGIARDEVELAQQEDQLESLTENWLFDDYNDSDPYQEEMTDRYLQGNEESSYQPMEVTGLRELPIRFEGDISGMGKSIAVSHNNPGNIKVGKFAQRYGATSGRTATDGGQFARFPDVKTGLQAQRDLLKSPSYANLTVAEAMQKWSNKGYGADLYPEVADKPMYLLTENELIELQRRQIQREDPSMYKLLYLK